MEQLEPAQQLFYAAYDGPVDEVRRWLDQGVPPDEYKNWVSAAAVTSQ